MFAFIYAVAGSPPLKSLGKLNCVRVLLDSSSFTWLLVAKIHFTSEPCLIITTYSQMLSKQSTKGRQTGELTCQKEGDNSNFP